jgi:hypothetical protein
MLDRREGVVVLGEIVLRDQRKLVLPNQRQVIFGDQWQLDLQREGWRAHWRRKRW